MPMEFSENGSQRYTRKSLKVLQYTFENSQCSLKLKLTLSFFEASSENPPNVPTEMLFMFPFNFKEIVVILVS